jgi:anti-sigma regulatory factor (Ser/Thr protein kinase)
VEHRLNLDADLSAIRVLRQTLLRLCAEVQANEEAAGDFALAVSEAFSNAVRHGTRKADSRVEVCIHADPNSVRVRLDYPGEPFHLDEPALPDPASTGGRGRYLMSVLADEVSYHFAGGMTQMALVKRWR